MKKDWGEEDNHGIRSLRQDEIDDNFYGVRSL